VRYTCYINTFFKAGKDIGAAKHYATAKRIVSPIYTFIEGREENFLLIPVKCEEEGVPHLLKQQHNQ
jgi:hypothetical protein